MSRIRNSCDDESSDGSSDNSEATKPFYSTRAYSVAGMVYVIAIGEGYSFSIFATVLIRLHETFALSAQMMGLLGSCHFLGMIAGAPMSGPLAERLGRKLSLSVASLFLVIGSLVMALSHAVSTLIFGRVLIGGALGLGVPLGSLYLVEMAPARLRGTLGAGFGCFLAFGIGAGGILGAVLQDMRHDWRIMLGLGGMLPSLSMILLPLSWFPESPRWLVARGQLDAAREALMLLGEEPAMVPVTLAQIQNELATSRSCERTGFCAVLRPAPALRARVVAAIGTLVAMFLSGVVSLIIYLPHILRDDFDRKHAVQISGGISTISAAMTIATARLPDLCGRKPLLIGGYLLICIAFSQMCLARSSLGLKPGIVRGYCMVTAFVMSNSAFQACVSNVTFFYPGEVLPSELRAVGLGLGSSCARVAGFILTMVLPVMLSLSAAYTYGSLAIINALISLFMCFHLRETNGLNLESVSLAFEQDGL